MPRTLMALALLALGTAASAENAAPDCSGLLTRFDALIGEYSAAGSRAIDKDDPAIALEKARKAAMKGDAEATVTMVGVGVALRGKTDKFPLAMIRQVCMFSQANGHPLHIVTCAYFNALNPLGNRLRKFFAAKAEIARFDKTRTAPAPGAFAPTDRLAGDIDALRVCLPKESPA